MPKPSSTETPARGNAVWPQRVPLLMILLAVPSVVIGLLGALFSISTIMESLSDRRLVVERTRNAVVRLMKNGPVAAPAGASAPPTNTVDLSALTQLPPKDAERLGAQLGDELYERRGALVPLSLMNLILCWLLVTGAMGALRRRAFAVSMWRWAALANIPFAGLSLLVASVRTRAVVGVMGQSSAAVLASVSKRAVEVELAALKALAQTYVSLLGLWHLSAALLFAVTALYLRRTVPEAPSEPRAVA